MLVVANPANTNCLITALSAPSIPRQNFTCLTRLDDNRACAQVAKKLGVDVAQVGNTIIWGNHSKTQYAKHHTTMLFLFIDCSCLNIRMS